MFSIDDWERKFPSTILSRGKAYFRQGKVKGYKEEGQFITAKVLGSAVYQVKLGVLDTTVLPGCTCPYFQDHDYCKHVAAVLYYREDLKKNADKENSANPAASAAAGKAAANTAPGKTAGRTAAKTARNTAKKSATLPAPKPKKVPLTGLFNQTYDMSDIYYNIRSVLGDIKVWNTDLDKAEELAERSCIILRPEDVEQGHAYDFQDLQAKSTFWAYFTADETYREQVQKEEDRKHEEKIARMKKRYRWYYGEEKEPRYKRIRSRHRIPFGKDIVIAGNADHIPEIACGLCGGPDENDTSPEASLCIHVLAALRQLDEYLYRFNPGDATDFRGASLLESLKPAASSGEEAEAAEWDKSAVIQLEPRISLDGPSPELSFKIGAGKMYILKDMRELVKACAGEKQFTLGKNNILDFSKQTFAAGSEPFYQLIEEETSAFESMKQRLENSYYYTDLKMKADIRLEGARLDEVFDLLLSCSDRGIEVKTSGYGSKSDRLRVGEKKHTFTLTVTPEFRQDTFDGIRLQADFTSLLKGKRNYYVLDRKNLRLDRIETVRGNRNLSELVRLSGDIRHLNVIIGRKNLSRFFYRTLPELEKDPIFRVEIRDEEEIRKYLFPKPEFTFYLDAVDYAAECRATASYGDRKTELKPVSWQELPLPRWRNPDMESEALQAVEEYFPEFEPEVSVYRTDGSDDQMFELLENGVDHLLSLGEVHTTDAFRRLHVRRKPPVKIGVSIQGNLLDLKIETEDVSPEELQDLLAGYRRKKKYHRLKNGSFVSLTGNEGLEALENIIETMGMSPKDLTNGDMKLPLYRALYLNQMLESHDEIACDRQKSFRKLIRDFHSIKDSDYDVPERLQSIMRGYQITANKWLRTLSQAGFGGILADDMGLGKTLEVISVFAALKEEGALAGTASLIVCPASLVYNWQEEFRKFAPEISVTVLAGTAKVRETLLEQQWEHTEVFVTSYDLLKRDIKLYEEKEFLYEILDEAQYIKNPKSAAAKSVKIISSRERIALTGTPIENQLSDLWSIFDFLMPGFLYDYDRFRSELETPIVKNNDQEAGEKLKNMVSPFILRRLKGDVLKDLPEKLEEIRFAKFEKPQQKLYDAQVQHMKNFIATADDSEKIKILAEITKVRQICCDPELLFENYKGSSAKREAALELIQSAIDGGHKILLFSQFTSMLELLEEDLKKEKIPYYKITGATEKTERLRLVHDFNKDDTPLFLISLKAGGTGLNLTGADVVIHYDPWWNLAAQNQATDRAHRIGQKNKVNVYKLIAKGTIEEKIVELQEAKKDLADAVIGGEGPSLASMSREELLQLFGD